MVSLFFRLSHCLPEEKKKKNREEKGNKKRRNMSFIFLKIRQNKTRNIQTVEDGTT